MRFFIFVIFIHSLILLFEYQRPLPKVVANKKQQSTQMIKLKRKKVAPSNQGRFNLKSLGVGEGVSFEGSGVVKGNSDFTRFLSLVRDHLWYPGYFVRKNISGRSFVNVFINGKGKVDFFKTKAYGHHFVGNFILRELKKILTTQSFPLSKNKYFKVTVIYKLTTAQKEKERNIMGDIITVSAYGGDEVIDKVQKGILKGISYFSNFLLLLEDRDKQNRLDNMELEKLKRYKNGPR